MILGELAKLKIIAFKDSSFDDSTQVGGGFFLVQVNPESYSVSYSASYNTTEQPAGRSGYDPEWEKNLPRTMSFDFLFDASGAVPSVGSSVLSELPLNSALENIAGEANNRVGVSAQIELFENTVFHVSGDTHVPNYLLINWGTLVFKCRLQRMNIAYKLFSPEGLPIRAMASATFMEVSPDSDEQLETSEESPDITHILQVRAGDTLPLMAKRIYGDERYYIAVAQANNLLQFRDLKPGQEIYFPPIERG